MVLPTEAPATKSSDKASKDVANILNSIKRKNVDTVEKPTKQPKLEVKPTKSQNKASKIPRGKPKSNRPWKEVKQK